MAGSFGGTVKLQGESEYRKALKEITSNLKVLGSEMKVVTSQFDKNDTSAENLTQQNEVLNKKITEQKNKVQLLTEALEKSKAETGETSETTKKWQTQLNNAQADLNKMEKKVADNDATMKKAAESTNENAKSVKDLGDESDKSGQKVLGLGDIIKGNLLADAVKGGISALVSGVKELGSAFADAIQGGAEYADNILTLSTQTGMATEKLEKYTAIAELTDVPLETMTKSMAKNTKAMGEAQRGSKLYAEAYEKLGIKVTDANGSLRNDEEVYWETVDALKEVKNETERDALAMQLFGKKAQDLNTVIEMGSEGLAEYELEAEQMGVVLGEDALGKLGTLDDTFQVFKSTLEGTKNLIAVAFAPSIVSMMNELNALGGSVNRLISALIGGDEEGISDAFLEVSDNVTYFVDMVRQKIPKMVEIFTNMSTMVVDIMATLIPQMITGFVSQLPQLINSGVQMLLSIVNGISSALPELIPTIVDAVLTITSTLAQNIDLIINAGIQLIMGLVQGLLNALPIIIERVPQIVDTLVNALINNLPLLVNAGIQLIVGVSIGLIKAIPQLVAQVPKIIKSLIGAFSNSKSQMGNIGLNVVTGIWEGISNNLNWIKQKIRGWVGDVTKFLKNLFGIHSPSTLMRDEIGTNLALGIGEGFEDTMGQVSRDMGDAIPKEFDVNTSVSGISSQASHFDSMVYAFKEALKDVKVVMDDREMGTFVNNAMERVVYA